MKLYAVTALLVLTGATLLAQPALSQSAMGGTKADTTAISGSSENRGHNSAFDKPNISGTPGTTGSGPPKGSIDTQGWYLGLGQGISEKAGNVGPKQAPSKAPLPAGYAYDPNGRIAHVGTDANGKTGPLPPGFRLEFEAGYAEHRIKDEMGRELSNTQKGDRRTAPPSASDAVDAKTATNGKVANGPKQETSKAPLPSGYAYDANGRIGLVGTDANGKTGSSGGILKDNNDPRLGR